MKIYGYVCDPTLSLSHNASIVISEMPASLYYSRPHNLAFHNLCLPSFQLPHGLNQLLGLGLSFCTRPPFSNGNKAVQLTRFRRDCNTRMLFAGTPPVDEELVLFIRSDWEPDSNKIPSEFRARVSQFIKHMGTLFKHKKQTSSSFLPSQQTAFDWLQNHDQRLLIPARP